MHPHIVLAAAALLAAVPLAPATDAPPPDQPDLAAWLAQPRSEMQCVVERFSADYNALLRTYRVEGSGARRERLEAFLAGWETSLAGLDFGPLSPDARIDATLLKARVRRLRDQLTSGAARFEPVAPFATFGEIIGTLAEDRRTGATLAPRDAAQQLAALAKGVSDCRRAYEKALGDGGGLPRPASQLLLGRLESLRGDMGEWFRFFDGYDPAFSWWCAQPFQVADRAMDDFARFVRERGVGRTGENEHVIVGAPIGREAILQELRAEMIPYTPEELIAIAQRELAWCEGEMRRASRDMGLGDDWKAALEKVKQDYVEPGEQPALIRTLARQAVDFVRSHDMVTVPEIADETWRMEMMSPERQLVNPFFTGGEVISVSFPTSGMTHEDKLMSLRGNNRHFAHATVLHELIPGHYLQQFSGERHNPYRDEFSTPFWTEGWAVYWELRLWDAGFDQTPEDRMGALFWRAHRCARIIFSLSFHLGEMTPQQCVDFLVDKVGHERANAEGEVRRSFEGGYSPLYQVAYMIGALQFRSLRHEVVDSGKMPEREFHDAILRQHNMPVEMVRAAIMGNPPGPGYSPSWRFDEPAGK